MNVRRAVNIHRIYFAERRRFYFFLLVAFAAVLIQNLSTQNVPSRSIELGVRLMIHSEILNEERSISVSVPRSYTRSSVNYPVIYVLDGTSLFQPTVAAAHFLAYNSYIGLIPEVIVVGIANTNRDRDMPVPHTFLQSNGAEKYLAFLSKELLPFINSHYRVNGLNVLIGHSQGGLFATYAGTESPDLFKAVIALDAPMTVIPKIEKHFHGKLMRNSLRKYITAETLYGWGPEFGRLNDRSGFKQLKIENESHETMPYKGIYEGLRFMFFGHLSTDHDLSLKNLQLHYAKLSSAWSCEYTIPNSVLMDQAIPMMLGRSKKAEAVRLIQHYEKVYGEDIASSAAMESANSIASEPDERVDYYLGLPPLVEESIKPFLGKWKGTLIVPGGMDTDIEWEIKRDRGRYIMIMNVMNSFFITNDFILAIGKDSLEWGRKHQSGGLYLSSAKLSSDGTKLTGTEDLIGHHRAVGEPAFTKNRFQFVKVRQQSK
ncbi:MAG: alpha/beta hydrolase [Bacteroidota bacterium]